MKMRKQWIAMLLVLAMLMTALPIAAFAEEQTEPVAGEVQSTPQKEEEQPEETEGSTKLLQAKSPVTGAVDKLVVRWKMRSGEKFYNTQDDGKEVILPIYFEAEGLNTTTNQREKFAFFYDQNGNASKYPKLTVGTDVEFNVPTDMLDLGGGRVYKDIEIKHIRILLEHPNRKYSLTFHNPKDAVLVQNMDLGVNVKLASDQEIILESDKNDMKVRYYAEKLNANTDQYEVFKNPKTDSEVAVTAPFKVGELNLGDIDPGEDWSFSRAVSGSSLELYNVYGVKYQTFNLGAEWTGNRKADLHKRYKLTVEGDDLKGWTVTLKSKIQFEKTTEERELPYHTLYENDPTMYEDQTRIKKHGVKGKEKVTTSRYYIDENGVKTDVDVKESKEILKPAVDEIILKGTKKRPQKPDRPSVPIERELVVFEANEGAWENGETRREYRRVVGSTITIESAPMREGYKFLYWKGSEYHPGESYIVPDGGHTFVAQWEKVEKKPEEKPGDQPSAPSVDSKIKTPRGSILTADEIAKILAGMKKTVPAIPKAGVGR